MNTVLVKNLSVDAKIGCCPEERVSSQRLGLDITVELNTDRASKTGDIADTVCYATVSDIAIQLSGSQEWSLVEEYAEKLSQNIFLRYVQAQTINIRVKKFVLPNTDWVGVEIKRQRQKEQ